MTVRPILAPAPSVMRTTGWADYALLDSGDGRKLERYGPYTVVRPEPQCFWSPRLPAAEWEDADAVFDPSDEEDAGRWRFKGQTDEAWMMSWGDVRFNARFTAFRHLAFFPEQAANWTWLRDRIAAAKEPPRVLNLFGYTGAASLIAAAAGAEVTHVDASKKAIQWARDNQAASKLDAAPVRWIVDDAVKFAERDIRRGKRYDGILLDPPRFGRGPDGEVWSLEADLPHLLDLTRQLLAPGPSFMVLTAYAIRASFLSIHEITADLLGHRPGTIASGELAVRETGDPERPGRLLATSMFSRFTGA